MIKDRPAIEIATKTWGFEKCIVNNGMYCGKFLYIIKGKHTSLHYHRSKDETFYIHSGKVHILFFDQGKQDFDKQMAISNSNMLGVMERVTLNPGDNFCIPPGRFHQIHAVEDTQLFEFSTAHNEDDTVRITNWS